MFSYFKRGVNNTFPNHTIDLSCLIRTIKHHHDVPFIEHIRQLRRNGDESYILLKKKLAHITPNCTVRNRNFETDDLFNRNFIQTSGYLYYDFDEVGDPHLFKEAFINEFKDVVALVSLSVSLGGISVLVRIDKYLSSIIEHDIAWEAVRAEYFSNYQVDISARDIGRCWFISSDPEVFVNYENLIPVRLIKKNFSSTFALNQGIALGGDTNELIECKKNNIYEIQTFKDCLTVLNLETKVDVDQPVLKYSPISYSSCKLPSVIMDGNKRKTYKWLIHTLCHLNKDIEPDYIFSYLFHINERLAKPKMDGIELIRLFDSLYSKIKNDPNYVYKGNRVKNFHFNKRTQISGNEKKITALRLNGKIRTNKSKDRIIAAVEELKSQGRNVTHRAISEISGLAISTVTRHYNNDKADIGKLVEEINQGNQTTRLDKNPWDKQSKSNENSDNQ